MEKIDLVKMMRGGFFDSGAKSVSYCEILDLSSTTVTVRYRITTLDENLQIKREDFKVVLKTTARRVDGMYYEIPNSAEIGTIEEMPFTEFAKQGQLFTELRSRIEQEVSLKQKIKSSKNVVALRAQPKTKRART